MRSALGVAVAAAVLTTGCALVHERAGAPIDAGIVAVDAARRLDAHATVPDVGPHGACRVDPRPRAGFGTPRPTTREFAAGYYVDLVVDPMAPADTYELHAADGVVSLVHTGATLATTPYDPSAIIGFPCVTPGGTTLHFAGYFDVDLCGMESLATLPAFLESTNPVVIDPPAVIAQGLECRDYIVSAITLAPTVAPGDYVFDAVGSYDSFESADAIEVRYDGAVVASAPYDWHEFPPRDFVFPGLFTITVETNVGGNLYSVHDSFFEGRSVLRIVCD